MKRKNAQQKWLSFFLISAFLGQIFAAVPTFGGNPNTILVGTWRGALFQPKEGGLFLDVNLEGFRTATQEDYNPETVQITISNLIDRQNYLITYVKRTDLASALTTNWRLPAAKYLVSRIVVIDYFGVRREKVYSQERKSFIVTRQCLSNLGLWTIGPEGAKGLKVKYNMVQSSYREDAPKRESSVAAVINGFTGVIQEVFSGKKIMTAAAKGYNDADNMRVTLSTTRHISMTFRLNLFQHNYFAKAIGANLNVYDSNLRQCYTDALERVASLAGNVDFSIILSKNTGNIRKITHKGGSIRDSRVVECLMFNLQSIQFPLKDNMVGELSFEFKVI